MSRRERIEWSLSLVLLLTLLFLPAQVGHAGIGDAFKKKAEKVTKDATKSVDPTAPKPEGTAAPASSEEKTAPSGGGSGQSVATVSTKFDFVPGDSVLFFDDFKSDDLGEFPARWRLVGGTFEVVDNDGERWVRCTSVDGHIRMKLPAMTSLPEFWTLEFDFFGTEPLASSLQVRAMAEGDHTVWEAGFPHDKNMYFRCGEIFSTTPMEGGTVGGRHHFMFMARQNAIKAYLDRQRMANVPDITGTKKVPIDLDIRLWADTHPMITNVRFAAGCRPAKDQLDEGKLVTHGIRFATGSDVVLPESAPVLRQVATYMESHPDVRLSITGHTDNVGTPASNLDLSKRRAASVAQVLASQFALGADRFTADGRGDTQPMASNGQVEGRAMNRRVEFAKVQ